MDHRTYSGDEGSAAAMPSAVSDVWHPPGFAAMMRQDVSALARPSDRFFFRLFAAVACYQVKAIHGLRNIVEARDPFILALNHTTFREFATVPAILMVLRGGRYIHFLADWKLQPVPGIGFMMRRGKVISITRKNAWPNWVNYLKRFYEGPLPPFAQARAYLESGASIGIFPEGDSHRNGKTLLRGRNGCARLSLQTGAPVLPAGIRFPKADPDKPIGENEPMEVYIGEPLIPVRTPNPTLAEVRAWHRVIMGEISHLCGKPVAPSLATPSPIGEPGLAGGGAT